MSNRIDNTFATLNEDGKTAFIPYICAGDPSLDETAAILEALHAANVDLIELGIPFSDPLADGPVIQSAAQRALDAGATVPHVLNLIKNFRKTSNIPIVLFTYLNPVYTYGYEQFHHDAAAAGADGVLVLDLPPQEAEANRELAESAELKHIRLIAPTTPPHRIPEITNTGDGFVYYVSREGVTGERTSLSGNIEKQVATIKEHTNLPVAVGFGISTPEQAASVAQAADGVVVGSAIVKTVSQHLDDPALADKVGAFVKPLVEAVKSV
ncbi:MAG: tryptophan synthase subunit alpha [Verrucomicrobiota bacterium]